MKDVGGTRSIATFEQREGNQLSSISLDHRSNGLLLPRQNHRPVFE
jgi:hypothetical protein